MKKILFKKLLFDCLKFFLISAIGISTIVWVFQAVNYLDIMVEDGRNYLVYFQYTLLSFPKIISKIFPFALFLSFFYVLSKYETNNELIIFWTHGISKIQIINFFLKASFILTILQIIFLTFAVPKSQDLARSTLRDSNINFFDNFLKPKKFNDIIKGVTIYSEKKEKDGTLKNIYIKKVSNKDEFEITYAKTGIIKNISNTQVLVLYNGQNIKGKKNNLDSFSFSKSDFNLSNLESNTTTYKKIQENTSIDLLKCYQSLTSKKLDEIKVFKVENCSISNLSNVLGELYKRIIIPLYIPIFILISTMLILISKEKVNYFKLKIVIFLFGFFTIIFSETTLRFVENNLSDNIKIIVIPIFLFILVYLIVFHKVNINLKKL
jgi:lipopolysaccharide export system permease protein